MQQLAGTIAGALLIPALVLLGPGCEESAAPPGPQRAPAPAVKELSFPPDPEKIDDLYEHCLHVVEVAAQKLPTLAAPHFHRGDVERRFGFDDRAIEAYRAGLEIAPNRPDIFARIGFLLSQQTRYDEAIDQYRAALSLDPAYPDAHTRIGLILAHEGRLKEAVDEYEKEISVGTPSPQTHYTKGQAHLQLSQHKEALRAFQACLRLAPDDLNAQYGLAQAYRGLERSEEARRAMERYTELRAKERAAEKRTVAAEKQGLRDKDEDIVAETYLDVAETYLQVDRLDEGIQHLQAAVLFDPLLAEAHLTLFRLLRQRGRISEARDHGEKAVAAGVDDPKLLYTLAGIHIETGNPRRGVELLEKASERAPQDPNVHRELARTLLTSQARGPDSAHQALQHAQLAVELRKEAVNYDVLAFALFVNQQRDKAIEALRTAIELDPDNPDLKLRLQKIESRR